MRLFLVLAVVFTPSLSLGLGGLSLSSLPSSRSFDFQEICDWFCKDLDYDYFFRTLDGAGTPRIFCSLCDKKHTTTTAEPTSSTSTTSSTPTSTTSSSSVTPSPVTTTTSTPPTTTTSTSTPSTSTPSTSTAPTTTTSADTTLSTAPNNTTGM